MFFRNVGDFSTYFTETNFMELRLFLRSLQLCSSSRTSQQFVEAEGSLPCSQKLSAVPYPERDQSNRLHSDISHTTPILHNHESSIFWEVIVSVILSKKVYMYMCPIPNGFRDRAISLYSSKIVDKNEILHIVSNTGMYFSSNKVGTVYLVQYIFENSTVNINAFCISCEDMACCSSVRCTVYRTVK
jgi:hypothetical protein